MEHGISKEEELRDKIFEAYKEGYICYRTPEGVMKQRIDDFVKQPLEGMLYDINRDKATILANLKDPKWINDFALTVLLEYLTKNKA